MKRALNIFTITLAAAALALTGWAGCRLYRFSSEYAQVWNQEITTQEVEQLEAENRDTAARLVVRQQELAQLSEQLAALSAAEQADIEDRIRACYAAREEAELTARSLVADALQKANYITLTPEQQESFGDVLIDEVTGNAILAGGVKAAIQASAEGKPLGDILSDALGGAFSGVQDYVQGEIQGAVSDTIGFDIFGVTDFASGFLNAGDVPVILVNSMVTAQRQDVSRLALFLEKEELTGADLQAMAALMERISDREQEIVAAGGTAGGFGGAEHVEQLALVWAQNNYRIIKYAELGEDTDEE